MSYNRILVQLKLRPEVHGKLVRSAEAHGRSVTSEVLSRIGFAADYRIEEAIGDLAELIAGRANDHLGGQSIQGTFGSNEFDAAYRARFLGVVRDSLTIVLNKLGAEPGTLTVDDFPVSQGISWDLPSKMRAPDEGDQSADGLLLGRIGKALRLGTLDEIGEFTVVEKLDNKQERKQ